MFAKLINSYRRMKSRLFPTMIVENGSSLSFDSSIKVKMPEIEDVEEFAFYVPSKRNLNFEVKKVVRTKKDNAYYGVYCIETNGYYVIDHRLFKLLFTLKIGDEDKEALEKLVKGKS